jgi:hypothetical protein
MSAWAWGRSRDDICRLLVSAILNEKRETYAESSSKDIAEMVVVLLEADLTTSTILGTAFDRAGSSAGVAVVTTARRAARASSTRLA